MKLTIYEYSDYKKYIHDLIASYPQQGRGQRKSLAETIGCQMAYITHVLSGASDFSLEQAAAAARHFNLSSDEASYFLLLVQENRAGSDELRLYFQKFLQDQRHKQNELKERVKIEGSIPSEQREVYFSSWQYAAVHMALTIPELQSLEALREYFHFSTERLLSILEFLVNSGLAVKERNVYQPHMSVAFLDKDSPLISKFHASWRQRALDAIEGEKKENNLHYSVNFSAALKDLPKVREILMEAIENCSKLIKESKEETLGCICVDLFRV